MITRILLTLWYSFRLQNSAFPVHLEMLVPKFEICFLFQKHFLLNKLLKESLMIEYHCRKIVYIRLLKAGGWNFKFGNTIIRTNYFHHPRYKVNCFSFFKVYFIIKYNLLHAYIGYMMEFHFFFWYSGYSAISSWALGNLIWTDDDATKRALSLCTRSCTCSSLCVTCLNAKRATFLPLAYPYC